MAYKYPLNSRGSIKTTEYIFFFPENIPCSFDHMNQVNLYDLRWVNGP